jgi:hypothetical protein
MGCMDQGRLKETQGLNPSLLGMHTYIYGLTVSSGLLHHGLVFLAFWCQNAYMLFNSLDSKVCTLHLFFPTFSLIILALFLM